MMEGMGQPTNRSIEPPIDPPLDAPLPDVEVPRAHQLLEGAILQKCKRVRAVADDEPLVGRWVNRFVSQTGIIHMLASGPCTHRTKPHHQRSP